MKASFATHDVFNQSPPFEDVNLFASDRHLVETVKAFGGAAAEAELSEFGRHWGSAAMAARGRLANENTPKLRTFDSRGNRRDEVEFHPAYHELMAHAAHAGMHNSTWNEAGKPAVGAAHVARGGKYYIAAQVESGHLCPITMTHACIGALKSEPELLKKWQAKITSRKYDPRPMPWWEKTGVTLGMGMTERQGGTDVRANTTRAETLDGAGPGKVYAITGHKWFLSSPMSDAFLVLAQAKGGLSCFFLPRLTSDGSLNGLKLQRLKDKLGNRSNASAEVEFDRAQGVLVGEEGRGIPTIIDMVTLTRLDCAVSSAGLMRQAIARAIQHARHRSVFQKRLIDQPLMAQVLADMALDVEAATALAFRLTRAFDDDSEGDAAYRRLMTPVTKYWVCKAAPALAYEAMECLGGNGYVEDGGFPRLYREVPVNGIWEGSGNVMCLDVLRVIEREPETLSKVIVQFGAVASAEPRLKQAVTRIEALAQDVARDQSVARALVELLALAAAAALLARYAPRHVSDAFLATRLGGSWRNTYGAGLASANTSAIVDRAAPQLS